MGTRNREGQDQVCDISNGVKNWKDLCFLRDHTLKVDEVGARGGTKAGPAEPMHLSTQVVTVRDLISWVKLAVVVSSKLQVIEMFW